MVSAQAVGKLPLARQCDTPTTLVPVQMQPRVGRQWFRRGTVGAGNKAEEVQCRVSGFPQRGEAWRCREQDGTS